MNECLVCGKKVFNDLVKEQHKRKYCSNKCQNIYSINKRIMKLEEQYKELKANQDHPKFLNADYIN
tara:strand:- start:664 stop:861 length:198 start_codon:yes stop_codon:yes gene_type:complete